jgi:hypothetical protein
MGAKADVYACIELPVKPLTEITYTFTTHGVENMKESGHNGSVEVSEKGISSVSLGRVEAEISFAGGKHLWNLTCNASDGSYNRVIETRWRKAAHQHIELLNPENDVTVCLDDALCGQTAQEWNDTPKIYIIFQPMST